MNLSVQRWWKDKMPGLQNIKCIPLGHTSRFHPFIMMPEISCETRFRLSREHSIYFYKRWIFFSFYIIIKTTLLRNCFEYAHTITKDWIYFESGLDCQSPKQIYNWTSLIHDFYFFRHQPQSNAMTVNLMYQQLPLKTFFQENWISGSFWQNRKF